MTVGGMGGAVKLRNDSSAWSNKSRAGCEWYCNTSTTLSVDTRASRRPATRNDERSDERVGRVRLSELIMWHDYANRPL